jgi:hypothetical protein
MGYRFFGVWVHSLDSDFSLLSLSAANFPVFMRNVSVGYRARCPMAGEQIFHPDSARSCRLSCRNKRTCIRRCQRTVGNGTCATNRINATRPFSVSAYKGAGLGLSRSSEKTSGWTVLHLDFSSDMYYLPSNARGDIFGPARMSDFVGLTSAELVVRMRKVGANTTSRWFLA